MAERVDAARRVLAEMTGPGVVTDHEQACAAGQRITEARFALYGGTGAVHPAEYPPPAAGDGRDVFRAADEGGEGRCTRKELAKYLMRNQSLRHRLREGWAALNANFGTEDVAENHEELDEAQFAALWQKAAAQREAAEHNARGKALAGRREYAESEAAFRDALRCDADFAKAHTNLGWVLQYGRSDYNGAEAAYREAVRCDPGHANAHFNLGLLLQAHRKDYDGAEAAYRAAVRCDPAHANAHCNLGWVLRNVRKDAAGAEAAWREAARLSPGDAQVHNNLGVLLKDRGDVAAARGEFEAALRCDASLEQAQRNLSALPAP